MLLSFILAKRALFQYTVSIVFVVPAHIVQLKRKEVLLCFLYGYDPSRN